MIRNGNFTLLHVIDSAQSPSVVGKYTEALSEEVKTAPVALLPPEAIGKILF